MTKERLTIWLAIVIIIVWTISFFADLFLRWYDPPGTVHGLMMLVAGGFLAPEALKGLKSGKPEQ